MRQPETIQLRRENNRAGVTMPNDMYKNLVDVIMVTINAKPEKTVVLQELIEQVIHSIPFKGVLPWHILQVKIDLDERGIIKISHDRNRNQRIEINRRNKRMITFSRAT